MRFTSGVDRAGLTWDQSRDLRAIKARPALRAIPARMESRGLLVLLAPRGLLVRVARPARRVQLALMESRGLLALLAPRGLRAILAPALICLTSNENCLEVWAVPARRWLKLPYPMISTCLDLATS